MRIPVSARSLKPVYAWIIMNRQKETDKEIHLSAAQQQAIRKVDGAELLLAVPGSGKTTTLVARLGYMIREKQIPPENILVITFTRSAAADMQRRYASFFGAESAERIHFSTINSFCYSVVLYYAKMYRRKKPADETNSPGIIRMLYPKVYGGFSNENDVKELAQTITYIKNMQLSEEQIRELKTSGSGLAVEKMYQAYQEYLKENYLMDYDDQILFAHQLLSNLMPVREHFQRQFPYVCVDEAQDTSRVQHEVIRLLAGKRRNLFMVGDEDQSIYGFRAAYPKALMDFRKNYPGADVMFLETNYRSAKRITELAAKFISGNKNRYEKKMQPARNDAGVAEVVTLKRRAMQYQWLVERLQSAGEDTAVLYRNNDSAIPVLYALQKAGIPCRRRNMDTLFFQNRVVQDAVKIMQFALHPDSKDLFWDLYYKFGVRITKKAVYVASRHPSRRSADPLLHALEVSDELGQKKREDVRALRMKFQRMRQRNLAGEAISAIRFRMDYKNADSEKLFLLQALADPEEERRIFYVGMTRARDSLILLDYENEQCPFINECQGRSGGWNAGAVVFHKKFGKGTVVSNDGKTIIVDFQRRGRTSMKLDLCIQKHLLR